MNVKIRVLTLDDLDDMVRVEAESWEPELRASRKTMEERLKRFPEGALGAYVNENGKMRLAGMTYAHRIGYLRETWYENSCKEAFDPNGKILYIINVGVSSKYRGQGIGSKLLDKNKELAKKLGCEKICLGARNTAGNLKFYKKNGFVVKKIVRDFWIEDKASKGKGIIMEYIVFTTSS